MTIWQRIRNILVLASCALTAALPLAFFRPELAQAAASTYVSVPVSVKTGDTINISISVNTGGDSANSFEGTLTYPTSLFDGVRGSYSGSICTLPIVQPEPSGGSAEYSCGRPGGFTGTGLIATVVLTAKAAGSGTIGLSGCTVLKNDGQGTNITGGCTGSGITVTGNSTAPTPTPEATTAPTPTPTPGGTSGGTSGGTTGGTSGTPRPTASARPTLSPTPTASTSPDKPLKPEEQPAEQEATPEPEAPPVQTLAPSAEATAAPTESEPTDTQPQQRRTVSQAFQDIFGSLGQFKDMRKDVSGLIAILVTSIPFVVIVLAVLYLLYRLYLLERRRRRTMDRLFEMELSELAALEGKLDLLSEKGAKGREQYREEFQRAKENILRQLRPDYGKPPISEKPAPEATPQPEH